MSGNFDAILSDIIRKEGGWTLTDDPADSGGRTYAGISERANPGWPGWKLIDGGCKLDPPDDELWQEVGIRYRDNYWRPIMGDSIDDGDVALAIMSCAVLSGPRMATSLVQACVGVSVDGRFGKRTLSALEQYVAGTNGKELFLAKFALARIERFRRLAMRRRKDRRFLLGWINRVLEET